MKMIAVEDVDALRAGLDRAQDLFLQSRDDYDSEVARQGLRTDTRRLQGELDNLLIMADQLSDWTSAVLVGKWYVDADNLHPHSPGFAALETLKSTAA